MSVSPEKPLDDGPALLYRTMADIKDQLSQDAQGSLRDVFDGNCSVRPST